MAKITEQIKRLFRGPSYDRETELAAVNLLQGCPVQTGQATLSAGSVVIPSASVLSNSVILITPLSSVSAAQSLYVSAISPGVSFTVTDVAGTSTATIAYAII